MSTALVNGLNADLLDENYARWRSDPASVDATWSAFFEGFELGSVQVDLNGASHGKNGADGPDRASVAEDADVSWQTRVDGLVYAYRTLGHTQATLDPLAKRRPEQPLLSLAELGFSEGDLSRPASTRFYLDGRRMKLGQMIDSLNTIYAGCIGTEFMHIQNSRVRNWIIQRLETRPADSEVNFDEQREMLRELMKAEGFEHFLHTKYVGQKRFGLEGAESLMVILNTLLQACPALGVEEIDMGMAHRGRLNVLANFLQKSLEVIFAEFSENFIPDLVCGDGDVKYHLGYASMRKISTGEEIEIRLSANPSHLEACDAVVEGVARARQRVRNDSEERRKVIPLLLHGDAAFAGQGMVAEVLNLSQLPGYKTGGTIHVIINNQIGFTTLPADARSSRYATDVAKMIEAPIFHVNGDDPIAVAFVTRLAFEYRQQFRGDVVIDMYCYRRLGHNEGDEPVFTQPSLYAEIGTHPSVATLFRKRLVESGVLTDKDAEALDKEFDARLEAALSHVKRDELDAKTENRFRESTAIFQPPYSHDKVDTTISADLLGRVVQGLTTVPEDFHVQPKVKRMLIDRRLQVHKAGGPFDWAYAEALAFGSLLLEKTPVRLSGQDSRRGTFSQRHSVLFDAENQKRYCPLKHLTPDQARFCVYNSLLSEAAVLGFDYGYSLAYPEMLCIWEAQFGDFVNGAQVIIDQFIVSSESKWQRPSGIVLLLPHGYEGQGPEHSSARIERFLQLCAEDNIQVCNPTTPAQYFHLLRRQMKRPFRKPLIIATPKSLLRSENAVSFEADFTAGSFSEILPGIAPEDKAAVDRVIFCSGKVYYDLAAYLASTGRKDAAIIRIEQLYPLNTPALVAAVAPYANAKKFVWCQEESQNMGAWSHIVPTLNSLFAPVVLYAGRNASSSPAVGSLAVHKREQKLIVEDAFNLGA